MCLTGILLVVALGVALGVAVGVLMLVAALVYLKRSSVHCVRRHVTSILKLNVSVLHNTFD